MIEQLAETESCERGRAQPDDEVPKAIRPIAAFVAASPKRNISITAGASIPPAARDTTRALVCYKGFMAKNPPDTRSAAEKAFKAATTRPADLPLKAPSVPGAKEMVSLRIDRDVLDVFQEDGPGWQDRINAALRKAAGK